MSAQTRISWTPKLLRFLTDSPRYLWRRYINLRPWGKAFFWSLVVFYIALATVFIVLTPARIFQWFYDLAQKLSSLRFGWLALGGIVVIVSFPPFIGHSTALTLCGFAYGMKGVPIAAIASSIGSALVFLSFRFLFSRRLHRWSTANEKWQALESVVRAKGLPLIILIRMSPMPPWVWSNILFSSIEAVTFWQFTIATLFVYPKVALYVFVGSRAAALSDGEQRSHMDTATKVLNGLLIGSGVLIALLSGWLIYRLMQRHVRQLPDVSADHLAADVLEDEEDAPLLRDFSLESADRLQTEPVEST